MIKNPQFAFVYDLNPKQGLGHFTQPPDLLLSLKKRDQMFYCIRRKAQKFPQ